MSGARTTSPPGGQLRGGAHRARVAALHGCGRGSRGRARGAQRAVQVGERGVGGRQRRGAARGALQQPARRQRGRGALLPARGLRTLGAKPYTNFMWSTRVEFDLI